MQHMKIEDETEFWNCSETDLHPIRRAIARTRVHGDRAAREFAEDIFYGEQVPRGDPDAYATYLTESGAWQDYRQAIFARQGGVCATCMNDATHCHHRSYAHCGIERDEDCVGLCANCHGALHDGRRRRRRAK